MIMQILFVNFCDNDDLLLDTSEFIDEMEVQNVEESKETKLFPVKQVPRYFVF